MSVKELTLADLLATLESKMDANNAKLAADIATELAARINANQAAITARIDDLADETRSMREEFGDKVSHIATNASIQVCDTFKEDILALVSQQIAPPRPSLSAIQASTAAPVAFASDALPTATQSSTLPLGHSVAIKPPKMLAQPPLSSFRKGSNSLVRKLALAECFSSSTVRAFTPFDNG